MRSSFTDVEGFASNLDVIKLNTEHVLEFYGRPVDVTCKFSSVIVTESDIRLEAQVLVLL
jgi:hypothetical protein